jgi:chaperonin GroES
MIGFRPLQNFIVVDPIEAEQIRNGIYLPDSAVDKPREGIVRAVGPGRTENAILLVMNVEVGDRVLFEERETKKVTLEGREMLILSEDSVYGILG